MIVAGEELFFYFYGGLSAKLDNMTKTIFRILLGLIISISTAAHAFATPSIIGWIEDTPFAISENHLYLLRTIGDSHGRIMLRYEKTYLIKLDLDSGELNEMHEAYERYSYYNTKPIIRSKNETFNLYTYLEGENASMILPDLAESVEITQFGDSHILAKKAERNVAAGRITEKTNIVTLDNVDVMAQINQSVTPVMKDYIGPLPQDGKNDWEVYKLATSFAQHCDIDRIIETSDSTGHTAQYLPYFDCGDFEEENNPLIGKIVLPMRLEFEVP